MTLGFPGYVHQYYVLWYTSGSVWVRLAQSMARVLAQNSVSILLLTVMDLRLRKEYVRLTASSGAVVKGGADVHNVKLRDRLPGEQPQAGSGKANSSSGNGGTCYEDDGADTPQAVWPGASAAAGSSSNTACGWGAGAAWVLSRPEAHATLRRPLTSPSPCTPSASSAVFIFRSFHRAAAASVAVLAAVARTACVGVQCVWWWAGLARLLQGWRRPWVAAGLMFPDAKRERM
jgi:hypothetical protein